MPKASGSREPIGAARERLVGHVHAMAWAQLRWIRRRRLSSKPTSAGVNPARCVTRNEKRACARESQNPNELSTEGPCISLQRPGSSTENSLPLVLISNIKDLEHDPKRPSPRQPCGLTRLWLVHFADNPFTAVAETVNEVN